MPSSLEDVRRELTALEQDLARAWVAGDRAAIDAMLADDWITTDITGSLRNKAQVMDAMFAATDRPISAMDISDLNVRVIGDAAVITGHTVAVGGGAEVRLRFTDVLERRAGRWLFVASQGTTVSGNSGRAEPILPSRNLDETREFYRTLGFTPWFGSDGRWDYEIVSRGNLVLHFFRHSELAPEHSDAGCYWRVEDADRLHQEFAGLRLPCDGIPRLTPPVDQPWGMREFVLVDPSGNLIRVGHNRDAVVPHEP